LLLSLVASVSGIDKLLVLHEAKNNAIAVKM